MSLRAVDRVVHIEDHLAQLIETLDAELEQLSVLRFRLVALASLVAADQALWLPMSVRELEGDDRAAPPRSISGGRPRPRASPRRSCSIPRPISTRSRPRWTTAGRRCSTTGAACILEQVANVRSVAELAISALGRRSTLIGRR